MNSPNPKIGDIEINRIGLGTNRLTDNPDNRTFLTHAVKTGVNLIDTAHLYTGGESERTIGTALAPFSPDLAVATKGGYEPGGGQSERLRQEIEQSLESLRTDVITLYYLHRVDSETPMEESLGVLKEYRDQGKIAHIGLSEVTVPQIETARKIVPVAAVQNEYNLSERKYDPVIDYCEREGIMFVPFFPLHGHGGSVLREIADRHDASTEQIMLAWLLKRSPIVVPIPGTLSLDHLEQNVAAKQIELSDADYQTLVGIT